MRGNPEARAIYRDYVLLYNALQLRAEGVGTLRAVPMDRVAEARQKRALRVALYSAAAILTISAVVMWRVLVPDAPPMLSFEATPGSAVTVTHLASGARWQDGLLAPGSRLELANGAVELTFGSGARSVITAPADFTLQDEDDLRLDQGTAWFLASGEAAGFTVRTPEVTVVDLGTEFGVFSAPGEPGEVHVFEGSVRVTTRVGGAHTATILTADEARAVHWSGKLSAIDPDPERFSRSLPQAQPSLHWTFDQKDPGRLEATGGDPAAETTVTTVLSPDHKPAFASIPGRFGRALASLGNGGLVRTDWPGISGDAPRTLACWIKLESGYQYGHPVAGWGLRSRRPDTRAFFAYVRTIPNRGAVAGVSFGKSLLLEQRTPVDDGRWHHFAVVYQGGPVSDDGPQVFCYLNGELRTMTVHAGDEASTGEAGVHPVETTTTDPASVPLSLFSDLRGDDEQAGHRVPVALDELHVFPFALSGRQVRNLYRFNQLDPPE